AYLRETVRSDPRREDRHDNEDRHEDRAAEQDPPRQAGRLPERRNKLAENTHQYRTLGSMSALTISITRLTTTTTTANMVMMPCTDRKSTRLNSSHVSVS